MNPNQENTDLTICRALLASWVFLYHVDLYVNFSAWLGPVNALIRRGYLGVDGFFLLSGFVLARAHKEFKGWPRDKRDVPFPWPTWAIISGFWLRRVERIYPVHLVTVVLLVLIFELGKAAGLVVRQPAHFDISALVQNLLLVQAWGANNVGTWNYPSWSISAEWAGYLLFPLLWACLAFWDEIVAFPLVVVATLLVLTVIHFYHGSLNLPYDLSLLRFFPSFVSGMAMRRLVPVFCDLEVLRRYAPITGGLCMVLFAFTSNDGFGYVGIGLLLFTFMMQDETGFGMLLPKTPVLLWLGRISYSFYMSFAVIELVVSQAFRRSGWAIGDHAVLFSASMLVGTLGLAVLLYTLVEVPCRRAGLRWLDAPAS